MALHSLALLLFTFMAATDLLFDFTPDTPADAWTVQDDVVMGGRSSSQFAITPEGYGRFSGRVSLENNGGFASILHTLAAPVAVGGHDHFTLRLQGDGKDYTFRVKSDPNQRYYHQAEFATSGEWETVSVPFDSMRAVHHGEPVDVPNCAGQPVSQMQLLIGNGLAEEFEILVDAFGVE